MKSTMKIKIIISTVVGVLALAVILAVALTGETTPSVSEDPMENAADIPIASPEVVLASPPGKSAVQTETPMPEEDEGLVLILDVADDPTPTPTPTGNSNNPASAVRPPEKPVVVNTPAPVRDLPASNDSPNIIIGDNTADDTPYKCGAVNHNCQTSESHAYIENLEIEGCSICGSHTCHSFYALNQWGYTRYTPSKCPEYNIKKDPVYTCQGCGKPTGDGTNGTCVQFVNADNCPNCDEYIAARTCHSCE